MKNLALEDPGSIAPPDLNNTSIPEAAEYYYAELNWTVIPIGPDKKSLIKWGRVTQLRPSADEVRSWWVMPGVEGLGVLNGSPSGGLVCRDFDDTEAYRRWAVEFPALAERLPTVRTRRGYHVYYLDEQSGRTKKYGDGELRQAGYNVLPPSTHPSGTRYEWIIPPTPDNLVQLTEVERIGLSKAWTERTENTETTDKTEITEENREDGYEIVGGDIQPGEMFPVTQEIESIISRTLPSRRGERHRKVFDLARGMKSLPHLQDARAKSLRLIVYRWHELALPCIGTKEFDETWTDFVLGWPKVKHALGEGPISQVEAYLAQGDLPKAAVQYETPAIKKLVAACWYLQTIAGDNPFFLSCRVAAQLIGREHQDAARYLRMLIEEGVILEVEQARKSQNHAKRYRYVGGDE